MANIRTRLRDEPLRPYLGFIRWRIVAFTVWLTASFALGALHTMGS